MEKFSFYEHRSYFVAVSFFFCFCLFCFFCLFVWRGGERVEENIKGGVTQIKKNDPPPFVVVTLILSELASVFHECAFHTRCLLSEGHGTIPYG